MELADAKRLAAAYVEHCFDRTEQHIYHEGWYTDPQGHIRCYVDSDIIIPNPNWVTKTHLDPEANN